MVYMRRTTTQPNAFPDRRAFLRAGLATTAAGAAWIGLRHRETARITEFTAEQLPAFSIIPVVGDGKWVWTHPPEETGYLEPREFELKIGIQMEGTGNATQLKATTPVPVAFPEQLIRGTKLQTDGCRAVVRPSGAESSQLLLNAPTITRRQTVMAAVTMRLTLFKQYLGYVAERFPAEQPLLPKPFRKQFLQDSPGIQTRLPEVRELAKEITSGHYHPWQKAEAFHYWVRQNIRARIGTYTSVQRALRDRLGDCEERAAVFVALCRAAGIPARLVWVPNHNWAEFYLVDDAGDGHWIPAAHGLVLVVWMDRCARAGNPERRQDSGARETPATTAVARLVSMDGCSTADAILGGTEAAGAKSRRGRRPRSSAKKRAGRMGVATKSPTRRRTP